MGMKFETVSLLIILLAWMAAAADNTNFTTTGSDKGCKNSKTLFPCVQKKYHPNAEQFKCNAWDLLKSCYFDANCTKGFIDSKKLMFCSKYNVKCVDVFLPGTGVVVQGLCDNSLETCESKLPLGCEQWHEIRECFDDEDCTDNEVETIKNQTLRILRLTCGTGSASTSIGIIITALAVILAR